MMTSDTPGGLVYTHDGLPGMTRVRCGKGFAIYRPDGSLLKDRGERRRIASLAIPPAYRSVWICMLPHGHLQATGIDDRGRKQYRYHPVWLEWSGLKKFDHLLQFAKALPGIRQRARRFLRGDEIHRERVIAAVVMLLDATGYRVGNARYSKENGSYGLTTLLSRHVSVGDEELKLCFRGKSGAMHRAVIADARLASVVAELHELPGQQLFRYRGEDGELHELGTADVNAWLKEAGGGDFSAKQFRTWRATVTCARLLGRAPPAETRGGRNRARNEAIRATAALLHHRPATCRKYYVHPSVLNSYRTGALFRVMNSRPPKLSARDGSARLSAGERRVFKILRDAE
jgi:DNA topoisomerase I